MPDVVEADVTLEVEVSAREFYCKTGDRYFGGHLNRFNDALLLLLNGGCEIAVLAGVESAELRIQRMNKFFIVSGVCAKPYLQWTSEIIPFDKFDLPHDRAFDARWIFGVSEDRVVGFQRQISELLRIVNRTELVDD